MNIRKLREQKQLSQSCVAKKIGITQGAYSNIENGKTLIKHEKLKQIAQVLEVTIEMIKNNSTPVVKQENLPVGNTHFYQEIIEQYKNRVNDMENTIKSKDELIKHLQSLLGR